MVSRPFKYLLLLYILLAGLPLIAQQVEARGKVFHDRNGNNRYDGNEKGIAGVAVSDQVKTVLTDSLGNFNIRTTRDDFPYLLISLPSGYGGRFYRPKGDETNFPLAKIDNGDDFTFIHASDTHIDSLNLPRMDRFRFMADSLNVNFVIITGDLIRDALRVPEETARSYFEMYLKEIEKFGMPVYSAVGNHELFGIERDKSLVPQTHPMYGKKMFRHYLGPNYYSFNYGDWHFIALDGVQYRNLYYYGGVDSLQMSWLEEDLRAVSKTSPIATFNHIPLASPGFSFFDFENDEYYGPQLLMQGQLQEHRHIIYNNEEVIQLFKGHSYALALAGHFHMAQDASFTGNAVRFSQTAAITRPDRFDYYGLEGRSGFTWYRISGKKVLDSKFIPLNLP